MRMSAYLQLLWDHMLARMRVYRLVGFIVNVILLYFT